MSSSNRLITDIEAGKFAAVYVLHGDETLPIRNVIDTLRARVLAPGLGGMNHHRFDGADVDGVRLILEACQQVPMMASHRLVEVSNPDQIDKNRKSDASKPKKGKDAISLLAAYIKDPNPSTILVVTGSALDGRSKLVTAAKKTGVALKFESIKRDGDAVDLLFDEAESRGVRLERPAAVALVQAVGTDQRQLMDAFERAALFAGEDKPVTAAVVENVVSHTRETLIFDLTDAVGAGDPRKSLILLARMFEHAGKDDVGMAQRVLAMLIRQIRLIFTAKMATGSIEGATGMPPFVARKLESQAQKFDEARLRTAYDGLVRLDRDLKGASQVAYQSPFLALQRWIMDVCQSLPGVDARV